MENDQGPVYFKNQHLRLEKIIISELYWYAVVFNILESPIRLFALQKYQHSMTAFVVIVDIYDYGPCSHCGRVLYL